MFKVLELLYVFGVLDEYAKFIRFFGFCMVELVVEFMMVKVFFLLLIFSCISEIFIIVVMISFGGSVWFYYEGE